MAIIKNEFAIFCEHCEIKEFELQLEDDHKNSNANMEVLDENMKQYKQE